MPPAKGPPTLPSIPELGGGVWEEAVKHVRAMLQAAEASVDLRREDLRAFDAKLEEMASGDADAEDLLRLQGRREALEAEVAQLVTNAEELHFLHESLITLKEVVEQRQQLQAASLQHIAALEEQRARQSRVLQDLEAENQRLRAEVAELHRRGGEEVSRPAPTPTPADQKATVELRGPGLASSRQPPSSIPQDDVIDVDVDFDVEAPPASPGIAPGEASSRRTPPGPPPIEDEGDGSAPEIEVDEVEVAEDSEGEALAEAEAEPEAEADADDDFDIDDAGDGEGSAKSRPLYLVEEPAGEDGIGEVEVEEIDLDELDEIGEPEGGDEGHEEGGEDDEEEPASLFLVADTAPPPPRAEAGGGLFLVGRDGEEPEAEEADADEEERASEVPASPPPSSPSPVTVLEADASLDGMIDSLATTAAAHLGADERIKAAATLVEHVRDGDEIRVAGVLLHQPCSAEEIARLVGLATSRVVLMLETWLEKGAVIKADTDS